jgi:hypothetical protein
VRVNARPPSPLPPPPVLPIPVAQHDLIEKAIVDQGRIVVVQRDFPLVPGPFTASGSAANAAKVVVWLRLV